MPIYEYQCKKCGVVNEYMEGFNSNNITRICPSCGGEAERIISASAFHLKGSGWYTTDYKSSPASEKPTCPAAGSKDTCSSCASAAVDSK